jgi:hypothetical protein
MLVAALCLITRQAGRQEEGPAPLNGRPALHAFVARPARARPGHSTVTLFARFLGWSTLQPRRTAT